MAPTPLNLLLLNQLLENQPKQFRKTVDPREIGPRLGTSLFYLNL
jgi:hypothetical protein